MQQAHPSPGAVGSLVRTWLPAAAAAVVALAATLVIVLHPLGAPEAGTAALDALDVEAAPGTATVLAQQPWGEGTIILTGADDPRGIRYLALAFVIDHGRGYRVAGRTEDTVDPTDVVVGSLLVASSPGGRDQPPWSAVYGEVSDERIGRVEVEWADGERTGAEVSGATYLVVREDEVAATFVRYLGEEDDEIAVVPVQEDPGA